MHKIKQKYTKNQKWVLASSCLGFTLEQMDILFLSFAMSSIIADFSLSSGAAGFIATCTNLGMFFGGIIFGYLGDRLGRVKVFNYTVLIFAVGTALMSIASNIYMVYAFRFVSGIGAGGEYGVAIAIIADNFKKNKLGSLSSLAAIWGQIGAIIAAIVSAWIIPLFGWKILFLLGILPVILTIFVRRHVKDNKSYINKNHRTNKQLIKYVLREMFSSPKLAYRTIVLIIMMTIQIGGYFGIMNWFPTILQSQLGIDVATSSYWMVAVILGMICGMFCFGKIFDKLGPCFAYTIFLIGTAIFVFSLCFFKDPLTVFVLQIITGFFCNAMWGGYGAVVSHLYPAEIRSSANNIITNIARALGGFSSVIIGVLWDNFSLIVVMTFLSCTYLVSLIGMLTLSELRKKIS